MWFESLSSLKINLMKSELILVENVFYVDVLADELEVASLPTTYLGMLLDAHTKSEIVWDEIKGHFGKRLALWKRLYLSRGWRNSPSLFLYLMSILPLPRKLS